MKFKHVATFLSEESAEIYKLVEEAHGYKVRIVKNRLRDGNVEWQVYQSREMVEK